jgi:S1-C subfamily serine protease
MKKTLLFLVILFLINSSLFGQSAVDIAKNWLPSTVSLVMEDNFKQPLSLGSGFILGNGKVVTNLHVIEGAKYGSVFISGSSTKHKIEGYFSIDKQNDLAILSVPTLTGKPIQLASTNPEIGEKVYAIGNPKGLSGTISEGIVSGIRDLENKKLIQITAPISPGSSGGPVLNNKGEVIGVAVGTLASGQNLNFVIPSSMVNSLMQKGQVTLTALNVPKGSTDPKTEAKEIDIKSGVVVRDFKYEITNYETKSKRLTSISILNLLPYNVTNIKLLFLIFDKSGIPIHYEEKEYFPYHYRDELGINPFLAKKIEYEYREFGRHIIYFGERVEIRVLDFRIGE